MGDQLENGSGHEAAEPDGSTKRTPGRDDARDVLRRQTDDSTAWNDHDPWFDERWSLHRARRRLASMGLLLGVFAAGVLVHAAWRALPMSMRSTGFTAGVMELSDPDMLEMAGFVKRNYSPLSEADEIAARVAFAQSRHAAQNASDWLGTEPRAVSPENPLVQMLGVTRSQMPGGGKSMHYRYSTHRAESPEIARAVSVFVQQDDEKLKTIVEGKTYLVISGDTPIRVWRCNGLAYFIVGESRWANNIVAMALGVPDATEAIRISQGNLKLLGDMIGDGKSN